MQTQTINPPQWPRPKGYANAMLADGPTLFLGGMIGWNAEEKFETDNFVGQVQQALDNIVTVLKTAGGDATSIVRMTWFIADRSEYLQSGKELGVAYRKVLGKHFPAMSVVEVSGFVEDGAKVEIEATAVLPRTGKTTE